MIHTTSNAAELLSIARGPSKGAHRRLRAALEKLLLLIPLILTVNALAATTHTPFMIFGLLVLGYITYITLTKVSGLLQEYDTDSSCTVSIYFTVAGWTLISAVSMAMYNPFALALIINVILPDSVYLCSVILLISAYIAYLLFHIQLLFVYPAAICALSYLDVLLVLNGYTQNHLTRSIKHLNILSSLFLATVFAYAGIMYLRNLHLLPVEYPAVPYYY